MPALHIHDVARIAFGTFGAGTWSEVSESVRETWRDATQQLFDQSDAIAENLIYAHMMPAERRGLVGLVEACRPFIEES